MIQKIRFSKYHGIGNDFILIDATRLNASVVAQIIAKAPALCHRHTGIGADGVLLAQKSTTAHLKMQVINSDGSESEMCGNGLRCFAKWAYDTDLIPLPNMQIETGRGILSPTLIFERSHIVAVKIDMGEPILDHSEIPISMAHVTPKTTHTLTLTLPSTSVEITPISMGNPHAVIFVPDIQTIPIDSLGPQLSSHPAFPKKSNIEWVEIDSPTEAAMIVWERGSGKTQACGTGACAVVVAGVLTGQLSRHATIHLPGGPLTIDWDPESNHVWMTGSAEYVYEGFTPL